MGRSRGELLERALATPAADHDAPVLTRPDDLAGDARMPGEGPEAIPDGRFERVTKLVARRPPLDLDQLVAVLLEQLDRVRAPTGASTARERNDGDGRTPAVELVPDRRTPARSCRAAVGPRGRARPLGRSGSRSVRRPLPCTSGTNARTIRVRRGCVGPRPLGCGLHGRIANACSGLQGRRGTRGTTAQARPGDRS